MADKISSVESESVNENAFLNLPAELIVKILSFCSIFDICSVAMTCKTFRAFADSQFIWKKKWRLLAQKSGMHFLPFDDTNISYKDVCIRLWKVCFQGQTLSRCIHCKQMTCLDSCLENWERKTVVDIGSKITWLLTTTFVIRRHPSVVAIRKTPSTDLNINSNCDPVCILCNSDKSDDFLLNVKRCNQNDTRWTEEKKENLDLSLDQLGLNEMKTVSFGYLSSLWSDILGYLIGNVNEWQMVSPLDCFTHESRIHVLRFYLEHILEQYKMYFEVRKPSVSFVLCEPVACSPEVRQKIAAMLFDKFKVSRICFLNKAVSVAKFFEQDTCLVVDSGANNTVVTLVLDGQAQSTQHVAIGGVAVAEYLARAIEWNGIMPNVSLSSLDTSRVKSSCRLPYNLATEERRKSPRKQSIYVRSHSEIDGPLTKLRKVELGSELHLAPEMMYASLDLPRLIGNCLAELSPEQKRDALSHIILTGGNTEMVGFGNRIMKDLRALLPEYSNVINTHTYSGSRSWDAVMGATRVPVPLSCSTHVNQVGKPIWISRESYIIHGTRSLE